MSTQPFDSVRYKLEQRQGWDTAAPGWRKWWQPVEQAAKVISDRLVELAEILPGQRVLDIATGIGEPAITAAYHVGPTGRITAIDLSPQMLEIGRARASELGLQNIDFCEMDAEALDLLEQSFDAILCRLGLMYLSDPQTALKAMLKLLVPDGKLATAVWGSPQKVPMASLPMGVLRQKLQLPPPPAGTPGLFSLADASYVEQIITQAGFKRVRSERIAVTLELPSAEAFVHYQQDIAPPINAILSRYPIEQQAEVWQAIAEAARQYLTADGVLQMENEVILVAGQRGR